MRPEHIGPVRLYHGDCLEVMRSLPECSVDAIVCDPPYGLSPDGKSRTWDDIAELRAQGKGPRGGFMGRQWDAAVPGVTWARECLRVLKPGGHLIAFSSTRTSGRLMCALEDGGFEIRDTIHWLHYQGFPKALDISKAIDKAAGAERGTPRHLAVDSRNISIAGNDGLCEQCGRHRGGQPGNCHCDKRGAPATDDAKRWNGWGTALKPAIEPAILARKPLSEKTVAANVLRWGTGALNVDACRYAEGDRAWPKLEHEKHARKNKHSIGSVGVFEGGGGEYTTNSNDLGRWPANLYHCPKPSRREREAGTEHLAGGNSVLDHRAEGSAGLQSPRAGAGRTSGKLGNHHPTVKPLGLMRWLVRLVRPPGGIVLDPFAGSGTTLCAGALEGVEVWGIELEADYLPIIRARAAHWLAATGATGEGAARPRPRPREYVPSPALAHGQLLLAGLG